MDNKFGMKKSSHKDGQNTDASGEGGSFSYHVPVLLREVIENLDINPGGIYVDCTFGGGGHSKAILQQLNENGKLVTFDQDADAKRNLPDDNRVLFVPQNFRHLHRFLRLNGIDEVDGVLADLGVSSHQFDAAERGFSTRFEASLDMRMDQRQAKTAATILNEYSEQQLHKLFEQYGEVTNSKTLARTIAEGRKSTPVRTIENLKNLVSPVVKGNPNKYLAQVFQALRIEVNDELGALKELLQQIPPLLKPRGRAAVITFHSLEDRLVKNFFRRGSFEETEANPFMNNPKENELKLVNRKPIIPSDKEMQKN